MLFLFSFSHCSYKVRLSLRVTGAKPAPLGCLFLLVFSQQILKGNEQYRKLLSASYRLLFNLWILGPTSSHVLHELCWGFEAIEILSGKDESPTLYTQPGEHLPQKLSGICGRSINIAYRLHWCTRANLPG